MKLLFLFTAYATSLLVCSYAYFRQTKFIGFLLFAAASLLGLITLTLENLVNIYVLSGILRPAFLLLGMAGFGAFIYAGYTKRGKH